MGVIDALGPINWEEESYPHYEDFAGLFVFAFFFPSIRFFLDRFVLEKLARKVVLDKVQQSQKIGNEERRKLNKFKESAWKFLYFLTAEAFALAVTHSEPWFTNTKYFWVGPGEQVWPDQKMRFVRVGSIVLALHDMSDIFLEIGKMSKYGGYEGVASFAFLLFVASWIILRLTYFPFWVIHSTSYEVLLTLDKEKHKVEGPIYYYIFNTLLICLLVLHIYWWVLIYRMLVKQIKARGQLSDDVRSASFLHDVHVKYHVPDFSQGKSRMDLKIPKMKVNMLISAHFMISRHEHEVTLIAEAHNSILGHVSMQSKLMKKVGDMVKEAGKVKRGKINGAR
ncbi:hypothetical protein ACLOJK_031113 [Asimina triloba]